MNSMLRWNLICWLAAALAGCGDQGEQTYPVAGTVTLDGEPVPGAIVAFNPKLTGRHASGVTDQSGSYQLTTNFNGDGAFADEYSVTIVKYESSQLEVEQGEESGVSNDPYDITDEYPAGYDEMAASTKRVSVSKNLLPRKYANEATSPLRAQVQPGTSDNVFDFQLKR